MARSASRGSSSFHFCLGPDAQLFALNIIFKRAIFLLCRLFEHFLPYQNAECM